MALPQTLPGFREFYPEAMALRQFMFNVWRRNARVFGFQEYDGPVLESLELFKAKSGAEIEEQLFSFTDKGGREVALRAEMTPTLARMVGAKAPSLRRPIKWFNIGEHYRYERQQKGRLRAFFQLNADIYGEPGPEAEVELIALLVQVFTTFGLTADDFYIRLSDRNLWSAFLQDAGLDDAQATAALGIIDKMERTPDGVSLEKLEGVTGDAARAVALLERIRGLTAVRSLADLEATVAASSGAGGALAARLEDWRKLLGDLDAMGLGRFVEVDLGVVRGLAYYTGFVFEAFDRKGELRALAGGGRYNDLVAKLGGPDLPAVGFAAGDVTLGELLRARGLAPTLVDAPEVFLIGGPGQARLATLAAVGELRRAGVRAEYSLRATAFGKQFKQADQSGARLAVILGEDEIARGVIKLRDLRDGTEIEIGAGDLVPVVRDRLAG
jgi:histidyl-tRNA synthetase